MNGNIASYLVGSRPVRLIVKFLLLICAFLVPLAFAGIAVVLIGGEQNSLAFLTSVLLVANLFVLAAIFMLILIDMSEDMSGSRGRFRSTTVYYDRDGQKHTSHSCSGMQI